MADKTESHIGTLGERSLHAALKSWYARPGDQFEVSLDGFVIDIVRDELLIEIQTRHLYAMKRKLKQLLASHPVHLLHPIAREKWIVRQTADGAPIGRRKSPKRGQLADIFYELVRMPHLLPHPNLTVEIILTREEQILRDDGQGSWRRRHWSVYDRCLLEVVDQFTIHTAADLCALLPEGLPRPFTNRQLAEAMNCRPALAQKMTYTLRKMGSLSVAGKQGNAHLYDIV